MQASRRSRSLDSRSICSSSRGFHDVDSWCQSFSVGVRPSGSDANASRISSSRSPTCWATRMNETRRIVERGPHVELLAAGGRYADLYHTQFGDRAAALSA